jgi:DnaJ-class molecular chaperone
MNINMRTKYEAEEKYCLPCHGAGKEMSGGMIYKKCPYCKGNGKVKIQPEIQIKKRKKDE